MVSLTRWLLRAFADNWPTGLPDSSDAIGPVTLIDRDDSVLLDVDTSQSPTALTVDKYSESINLNVHNALGVGLTGWSDTPGGLGGTEYLTEPVLSVRLEGASPRESGHVPDAETFSQEFAQVAQEIVQRDIDNGTLNNAPVDGLFVAEPQNPSPDLVDYGEYYRWDFEVQPRGYRQV